MKNTRNYANEHITNINKYMSGTPFYCKSYIYTIIVVLGTLIDFVTLWSLNTQPCK